LEEPRLSESLGKRGPVEKGSEELPDYWERMIRGKGPTYGCLTVYRFRSRGEESNPNLRGPAMKARTGEKKGGTTTKARINHVI